MILFKPHLAEQILAGRKDVTRRPLGRRYCEGGEHGLYVRPPWMGGEPFARARLVSVTVETLGAMTEAEALREGFTDLASFWEELRRIYPEATKGTHMQRLEFVLV